MNSRNYTHPSRRPSGSRRARLGIKAVNKLALLHEEPATRRWIAALQMNIPATVRIEGEAFAREGMVMSVSFYPGRIEAVVQPALPAPHPPTGAMQPPQGALYGKAVPDCKVLIAIPRHDEAAWDAAVRSLASDSAAVAPLLAGEWPSDLDDVLARHGAPLSPRSHEQITMTCSCAASGGCAHIAAAVNLAVDRMHDDRSLAIVLRGLPPSELVDRVRQVRTATARRSATGAAQQAEANEQSPLTELSLEEFWRNGPELEDLAHLPPPNHAPHALLRRLGPSPLGGTFPLVGLLASAYDTIKSHAEKLRDDAEAKE